MVFYLNYLSNEEYFFDLRISLSRKLNSYHREFLRYLLEVYSKKKETFIEVTKESINKNLNFKTEEELQSYLDKFMKIKVNYSFRNKENYLFKGAFHILDSYFIQDKSLVLVLSKELLLSFDENNFFNKVNLRAILNFRYHCTLQVYLEILNNSKNTLEGYIDFELEHLKEILELTNSYDRFYDFEKKVLEPICEDMNKYSDYKINISKIKKSEYKSAKVIGVKIEYTNKKIASIKEKSNNLLVLIKDKVKDFDLIYNNIYDNIRIYGYDYVYSNLIYTYNLENSDDFDNLLIKNFQINGAERNKKGETNKVIVEKLIKTPFEIHEELTKILLKLDLSELLENHIFIARFIKDIYKLKEGENYMYRDEVIKVEVSFSKKNKSRLEVEKF